MSSVHERYSKSQEPDDGDKTLTKRRSGPEVLGCELSGVRRVGLLENVRDQVRHD